VTIAGKPSGTALTAKATAAYTQQLVDAGFGQVEIRARRPYRLLDSQTFQLDTPLLMESLDSVSLSGAENFLRSYLRFYSGKLIA
jgi:hypothetical protein